MIYESIIVSSLRQNLLIFIVYATSSISANEENLRIFNFTQNAVAEDFKLFSCLNPSFPKYGKIRNMCLLCSFGVFLYNAPE